MNRFHFLCRNAILKITIHPNTLLIICVIFLSSTGEGFMSPLFIDLAVSIMYQVRIIVIVVNVYIIIQTAVLWVYRSVYTVKRLCFQVFHRDENAARFQEPLCEHKLIYTHMYLYFLYNSSTIVSLILH